jgi:hypothetical protein
MAEPEEQSPHSASTTPLWALCVLCVAAVSVLMSLSREYQVDEAQTVYSASAIANGWETRFLIPFQMHVFPLSLLVGGFETSPVKCRAVRLAFWAWFS